MKILSKLCLTPALCLLLLTSALTAPAPADPLTSVPVGTVISYYGTTAPSGYFVCNGGGFNATTYPELRAVLGSSVLPDLRGYFIRGYDTRNTVDANGADRALGSAQGDAIRNITGSFNIGLPNTPTSSYMHATVGNAGGAFYPRYSDVSTRYFTPAGYLATPYAGTPVFDASRVVPTAAENRPKNKTLLYCIKHDEPATAPVPVKASVSETVTGTDNAKYATPAGVKAAIDAAVAMIPTSPAQIVPDLRLGAETVWPVRYKGKQVYARLVDFGALPVAYGMKMVTHGIADIEWCQAAWDYSTVRGGSAAQSADLVTLGLASTPPGALNMQWRVLMDKNAIHAHSLTNNANTAWSAEVCVLYTKTTDEPLP